MKRRTFVRLATAGTLTVAALGAGGALWLSGPAAPVSGFATIAHARRWVQAIGSGQASATAGWPVAQVFEHCAQSIEYSLSGFPQANSAAFQHTAGSLAFATFTRVGRMQHDLEEPIPGAPALVATDLAVAAQRLDAALAAFEAHTGPLSPHFAYGALDKAQYTRAHLMHLANHAERVRQA
ncbi:DUF1569 domain-containing protein [Arenimonas sp. MALMAid1274]|uniref:DUF1569 domain-containing protein n=1 Tax=Arenimonas sp. MALMAid1274 TaxID=3411630 RepID=UPI003BA35C2A